MALCERRFPISAPMKNEMSEQMCVRLEQRIAMLERETLDQRELLERERKLRRELAQDCDASERLAEVVSHDLRATMNATLAWCAMLQREPLDTTARTYAIATVARHARFQLAVLDELLDITRVKSGRLKLQLTTVDMTRIAREALEGIRTSALDKRVVATLEGPAGETRVLADVQRVRQIMTNLLANALRATPEGGHIEVRLEHDERAVLVSVSDSGPVMAPDALARIFEGYAGSVDAIALSQRRGVELHIVRRLVELHGGTVQAAARERQGTVLTIAFPFRHDSRDVVPERKKLSAPGRFDGIRMLVVDSDIDARDLLAKVLRDKGASVAAASEVSTALGLVKVWTPDIVFSASTFPSHDGAALVTALRRHDAKLPVIMVSGAHHDGVALGDGVDCFVPKPLDVATLFTTIERLLARPTPAAE